MGDNTTQKKESLEVVSTQQVAAPKGEVIEYDRGNERFLAYFARFRQLINSMNAARRYLAYSSDVGESFRPILHPKLVTASYGLSWAYVIGECAYLTYLDRTHGEPQNV
jgi:fission process protein 1